MTNPLTEDPRSSTTLHGWKEIATHLGRSVRAVQRWERELGLPVRRIKTSEGQTVYADRRELDDWKQSRDLPKSEPAEAAETEVGWPPDVAEVRPRFQPTWSSLAIAATLALFVGGLVTHLVEPSVLGPISTIQVAGASVSAFDAGNRLVWRHEMGEQVALNSVDASGGPQQFITFGDGSTYLVPVTFNTLQRRSEKSDALLAFDRSGNIRWKLQPDARLNCAGETLGGPWHMSGLAISADDERPRLWVSFNHPTWWPGLVYELDATGRATLRYRQNGWVRGLAEWQSAEGHLLAINGISNEFNKASTTLLSLDGPAASEPHSDPRFDCADTPAGRPSSIFLWPALDVLGPEPYSMATEAKINARGLQVLMGQGGGNALAELDSPQTVMRLSLLDNYWAIHRQREIEGWLKHPADTCPERNKPQPIDHWRPSTGWAHTTIIPTVSATPGPQKRPR